MEIEHPEQVGNDPESEHDNNDKLESIYVPYHFPTPSRTQGLSLSDENKLRALAVELIIEAGFSLRLPWSAVITAQTLFHRFYYRFNY